MSEDNKTELPKYLENGSVILKDSWVLREKLKQELDSHTLRYVVIENSGGVEKTLDCKAITPILKKQLIKHSGEIEPYFTETLEKLTFQHKFLKDSYYLKISLLSRRINTLLAQEGINDTFNLREEEILEMFGKHHTIDEVFYIVTKEWGHKISMFQLKKWIKLHESEIENRKTDYIHRKQDFRVSQEASRLELINTQLFYWQKKFEEKQSIEASNQIIKLLEQARKEVKGDQLKLTMDGKIDINATLHGQENIMRMSKKLPINMLVIGMVAAKQGIDPASIMASLATSYYSKHNGFNGNVNSDEEIQSPVNLIKQYDWDDLGRKNKQFKETIRPITDITEYENVEDEESAVSLKQSLLDSLNKA